MAQVVETDARQIGARKRAVERAARLIEAINALRAESARRAEGVAPRERSLGDWCLVAESHGRGGLVGAERFEWLRVACGGGA